jgi:hypothetical protein
MGYNTYFAGQLEIKPPLTENERKQLLYAIGAYEAEEVKLGPEAEALKDRIEKHAYDGSFPFDVSLDGKQLEDRDREEHAYPAKEILRFIIVEFLAPLGHALEGSIEWTGDDAEDRGTIYANGILVEWVQDVITNPGPSWARA